MDVESCDLAVDLVFLPETSTFFKGNQLAILAFVCKLFNPLESDSFEECRGAISGTFVYGLFFH